MKCKANEEKNMTFRALFFRYYDRTVGTGMITFFDTKISKGDFTRLCTDQDFVLSEESLERAMTAMRLDDSEKAELREVAAAARKTAAEKEDERLYEKVKEKYGEDER